jgi:tetratricopeptide (TPR) repeat protein
MTFGQATRRTLLGMGMMALTQVACVPDNPAPPPVAKPAEQKAEPPDLKTATSNDLLKMVEGMKAELKNKERDFNINLALGNLYYDHGKYIDAIEYFTDAVRLAATAEQLVLKAERTNAGPAPAQCVLEKPTIEDVAKGQKQRSFEIIVKAATDLAATDPKASNACFAQLAPVLGNLYARRGNSWYLVGNAEKAKVDHAAALALDPENPEALFFSGAVALETSGGDEAKIAQGRAFWERLLKAHPEHPRAEIVKQTLPRLDELFGAHRGDPMAGHPPVAGAGGNPHGGPMQGPGPLPAGMEEIAKNTPQTPELEAHINQTLDKGDQLLKEGKWDEALATFKTIMPIRPSARVALGMGIALRELGKPSAEMVLTQAGKLPGGDPNRARFELAKFYESKNPAQAKAIYSELTGDAKLGAEAKARLATLK